MKLFLTNGADLVITAIGLITGSFGLLVSVVPMVHAQSTAAPYTSATRYDVMGRVTGTILPDPDGVGLLKFAATRTTFDAAGRPFKQETGELAAWQADTIAPTAWTGFTVLASVETSYDVMSRKVKELSKGSNGTIIGVTHTSYDARGRLECSALRMNPAIYASLPASACTLGAEGTGGPDRITRNVYDAAGQVLKVQKAVGTPLQQDYATYTYTLNGKQQTVNDANGNLATYVYDGHDRLIAWRMPDRANGAVSAPCNIGAISEVGGISGPADARNASDDCEKYSYDRNGNRAKLVKRDGSVIKYQYDALNRNTVKVVPPRPAAAATPGIPAIAELDNIHTKDVYYGYDLRGLQTYARFDSASGQGITNSYDGFGRMIGSAIDMDGTIRTLTYAYDKNGNRTNVTLAGTNGYSYAYDGLNRMSKMYLGTGTAILLKSWTYNNRATLAGTIERYGTSTAYTYDPVGRLSNLAHNLGGVATAQDVAYGMTYNPVSQIATRSTSNDAYAYTAELDVDRNYTVNGLNQYTGISTNAGGAFGYDLNGNLTFDGASSYTYDIENRLIQSSGLKSATLRYDPLGRLYETSAGTAATTTRLLYDGDELMAEYTAPATGTPVLLRQYGHGAGSDDPVFWYQGAGTSDPRFLHANHQGSIVAVTNSAGTALAINAYDEWGIPAATNQGRFQYTGQAWIPELGLYYYKARIYSPTLGRFMQTDPIGYDDQVNLYAYVGNDPVNMVDPSGMQTHDNPIPLCPSNDASCTQADAVMAPLSEFESGRQSELSRNSLPSGAETDVTDGLIDYLVSFDILEAASSAATIAQIGPEGEKAVLASFEQNGLLVIGSQIYIETAAGIRIADFAVTDASGSISLVEVKANTGRRSFSQARKDFLIQIYGGVSRSRINPAFNYGSIIKVPTVIIQVNVPR